MRSVSGTRRGFGSPARTQILTLASISFMTRQTIEKTKKVVIPTFMLLFIIGGIESVMTSNEFGLTNMIIDKFLIPIIVLSTLMSGYWILLTDDFWDLYEDDIELGPLARTLGKFLIWVPAMGLCFYLTFQGVLSIYNRTTGEQKLIRVSGQIIDKDNYRSRYYFEIEDDRLGRKIEIKTNKSDFESYGIGDTYSTEKKIGTLGLIYN
jgi:hypothetical protein